MTLKIGWIGCGTHAGQMLLPQLVRLDVEIAALCDTNAERLAGIARRYGVRETYANAADLIAHAGLDAIGMAVGPAAHYEIGLKVLQRGLPLFMEKPPAATVDEAERLAEAASRADLPVVVGFMKRYATGNRMAHNIIEEGRFGRVLGIMGWYLTAPTYFTGAADYNGFFLHHCVHYMDLVPWMAGAAVEDVTVRSVENGSGRLLLHASLALASGAIATIAMGTVQSRGNPVELLQITGDHHRIEVSNVSDIVWYRDPPFKAGDPAATLNDAADALMWRPNLTAAANEDHKGYHAMLKAALAALRGEVSDAPRIADGVAALRTLSRMQDCIAGAAR